MHWIKHRQYPLAFAPVLYEGMKALNPNVVEPSKWYDFNFWRPYLDAKDFYKIINSIYKDQEMFIPYPDAQIFLLSIKDMGFYKLIASYRNKDTFR